MIGTDSGGTCADACADAALSTAGDVVGCVDLTGLADEGYLAAVPQAPSVPGGTTRTTGETGYYLNSAVNGSIKIGSCDSEGSGVTDISVLR